jgi:hypothetical protein
MPFENPELAWPMKLPAPMIVARSLNNTRYNGSAPPPIAYMAKLLDAASFTRQDTTKKTTQKTIVMLRTIVASTFASICYPYRT